MAPPLLSLTNIALRLSEVPLFSDITLHIGDLDRLALVGRNGAGKSTLMRIIAGLMEADSGERFVKPGTHVAYLPQEPDTAGAATLGELASLDLPEGEAFKAQALVEEAGFNAGTRIDDASGGELRRAAAVRALACEPQILLLDEPTNHLDIAAIEWLEGRLRQSRAAMIMISHDRQFLENLCRATLWLDRGIVRRHDGPLAQLDDWQDAILEAEAEARHKQDRLIKHEARWAVEGISGRRKRNQGRLRRLSQLRMERRDRRQVEGSADLTLAEGQTSGKLVADLSGVSKSYGQRPLFSGLDFRLMRGDRVGLIGPNGVGKTTLLNIMLGNLAPDEGKVRLGSNLQPLVIDQKRIELDEDAALADILTGGRGETVPTHAGPVHVASYMKRFLFNPAAARTPVRVLSGGERNRLMLAARLAQPGNLLVLDEPTNDLDLETLDLLEEMLADFGGTLLLVSHDRRFLDRVVTSVLAFDGQGRVTEHVGGYSDYLQRSKRAGPDKTGQAKTAPGKTQSQGRTNTANVVTMETAAPKTRRKLSYKDQRALDQLPAEIEALNGRLQLIEAELADPALYSQNPTRFADLTREMQAVSDDLEAKEMRWLELEELREVLEAGKA